MVIGVYWNIGPLWAANFLLWGTWGRDITVFINVLDHISLSFPYLLLLTHYFYQCHLKIYGIGIPLSLAASVIVLPQTRCLLDTYICNAFIEHWLIMVIFFNQAKSYDTTWQYFILSQNHSFVL